METKRSRVKGVAFKKEGSGQYGKYYIFTVMFDNGDSGDYMAKSNPQTYFIEGQEADYTKEVKQNGNYTNTSIKPIQAQGGGKQWNGGSPTAQNRRTAMECATSLVVAGKIDLADLRRTASGLYAWISETDQPKQSVATPSPKPSAPEPMEQPIDYDPTDLPF